MNEIPNRIAVFDLEMPSARRDAISAVGITLIEGGKITNSYYTLVNPECPFDPFTVELTGITPEMAAAYPNFGDLWEDMRPWFEGALLCAHGASGDLHVLARTLRRYRLEWVPTVRFLCTVEAAKACFPEAERYSLGLICKAMGIPLNHHVASSDAAAAAELLLRCLKRDPTLPGRAKEYDMAEAHVVGARKRPRRRKSGAALNIETELKKQISKPYAAAKKLQYRDTEENVLGVKSRAVKKLAQRVCRKQAAQAFLEDLPHTYLEEDLLHAYLLDLQPKYDACLAGVEAFLPNVFNDDVFFALKPRALLSRPEQTAQNCERWIESEHPYTAAFGIRMLAQRVGARTLSPETFNADEAALIAGLHISHPTAALAAADYFFRILKFGGEPALDFVRAAAETCTAAARGLYLFGKDTEANGSRAALAAHSPG